MSKELKALENIKREAGIPYFSTLYDIDMWREDFKTVETALKALEVIKKLPEEEKQVLLNAIYTCTKNEDEYNLLKEILL